MHARLVSAVGRGIRVRRLGGDRAGEIRLTRFLRNGNVSPGEMAAHAAERLGLRCADRHVLAIQDTTVVKSSGGGGLYLHVCAAVDADDGTLLGLAHARFLKREEGRKAQRRALPTAAKESQRWLEGANDAARACRSAREITIVADRESDIYAAFAQRPAPAHMIVRAAQDRSLAASRTASVCSPQPTPCPRRDEPGWICRPSPAAPRARRPWRRAFAASS